MYSKDRPLLVRIKRLGRLAYLKLFRINDSPLKIALGFGLGAFVGVMPGMGPVIAFGLAFLFRVNRASALLASFLFNTWIGILALVLAVRLGAVVLGLSYQDVYADSVALLKNFRWESLFEVSVYKILFPIGVGYLLISLFFAIVATLVAYVLVLKIRARREKKCSFGANTLQK